MKPASASGRWLDPLPAALAPLRDCLGPRAPKGAAAQFTKDRAHRLLQRMKCGWADGQDGQDGRMAG